MPLFDNVLDLDTGAPVAAAPPVPTVPPVAPVPSTPSAPVAPPASGGGIKGCLTPACVLVLAGVIGWDIWDRQHAPSPGPPPPGPAVVDGVALGKQFAPQLAQSYAQGWTAAASALEAGKSVSESQAALQTTWQAARTQAFTSTVAPQFARVLPEGTEPSPGQRTQVVSLWKAFASGLGSAK